METGKNHDQETYVKLDPFSFGINSIWLKQIYFLAIIFS